MSLPKKMYRLAVVDGGSKNLRYAQRGGGTFASLSTMKDRRDTLDRQGVSYKVYVTETNWQEVNLSEEED